MIGPTRSAICLIRVGLHLAFGLTLATFILPFLTRVSRRELQRHWSRELLGILGMQLEVAGADRTVREVIAGELLVANHVSWLDVFVINSLAPATFVCKSEVRRWPVIGTLCARTGTIFLDRSSKFAAQRTLGVLAERLRLGERVALFPEGTTGDGSHLLPFHPALLQSAVVSGAPIQPVAIRYLDSSGKPSDAANYCGETSFWQSLRAIASTPGIVSRLTVLEQIPSTNNTRKELTEKAHGAIRRCLTITESIPLSLAVALEPRLTPVLSLADECQAS